jgi:hypothetical protein
MSCQHQTQEGSNSKICVCKLIYLAKRQALELKQKRNTLAEYTQKKILLQLVE